MSLVSSNWSQGRDSLSARIISGEIWRKLWKLLAYTTLREVEDSIGIRFF